MSVSSPTPNTINSHSLYQHSCTAVRIPTSRAHSESIVALFEKPVDVAAARKALEEAPGVLLKDDPENMVSHGYFIALMILVNENAKKIITPFLQIFIRFTPCLFQPQDNTILKWVDSVKTSLLTTHLNFSFAGISS